MCGFLQVFSRGRSIDRERFEQALGTMKHRGPDATGTHYATEPIFTRDGEPVHIASGHQRLSILDLDPRSHQPFVEGRQCLVFNGEIYNYRELRESLPGVAWRTSGDTEVLLQGLAHQADDFLSRANGMWAFGYVDAESGKVMAARDRHGKKPLFYSFSGEHLILSSTVQAIHRYLGTQPRFKAEFVDRYLIHGAAFPSAGNETHWQGIHQVPPCGLLEFDPATWRLELRHYFDLTHAAAGPAPADADLPELFIDAVRLRLVSDRKVGLLLSGGIDSTIVLSALHKMGWAQNVHCFIGEAGRSEDADYAKQCAERIGIPATVVELGYGGDTLERVLAMCRHHEKPFPFLGSSIAMAEMYEHIARHDVRVVLDGTGGDEIFGGYWGRYFPCAVHDALRDGDYAWIESCWKHLRHERPFVKQGVLRHFTGGLLGMDRMRPVQKRFSPVSMTLGLHRLGGAPLDPLATFHGGLREAVLRDISPGGRLGEWIWHNDRNSMMWGIEGRSPLLDYRLIPFVSQGYATKFHHQWNKHPLRQLFDALTPLPTQWRQQKQGFRWDGKSFLRGNRDAILERIRSSPYLAARYSVGRYVDRAAKYNKFYFSGITPRLLCIAGIESGMDVAPD
jgi:asparagine synthase (glutamine-hydrolysing)